MLRPDRERPGAPNHAWRGAVGLGLALSLALVGTPAWAGPSPAQTEAQTQTDAKGDGEVTPAPEPAAESDAPGEDFEATVETGPVPSGGGVAGAIVDPNDPNATRAQSDLEGESLDTDIEGLPERLPRLQAAAWWTTFGAIALGTTGGVMAGLAEARQDQADRLAYGFDLNTGRAQLYADVADEYEQLLDEGVLYQNLARGFIIAGGATLVAGIVMFAVEGARRRKAEASESPGAQPSAAEPDSARIEVEPGVGGLRLRF